MGVSRESFPPVLGFPWFSRPSGGLAALPLRASQSGGVDGTPVPPHRIQPVESRSNRGMVGARMSRPVSRILCPVRTGWRPSIWAHRRRVPRAVHPQARASSPRTPAQPHRMVRPSTLLRAGFTEPPRSPGALVRSYRTVSPLPRGPDGPRAVCFLWHCPAGRPGLPLATALLCGVRTFLGARRDTVWVSVPGAATARPAHPPHTILAAGGGPRPARSITGPPAVPVPGRRPTNSRPGPEPIRARRSAR